jgi:hypothetical protein
MMFWNQSCRLIYTISDHLKAIELTGINIDLIDKYLV